MDRGSHPLHPRSSPTLLPRKRFGNKSGDYPEAETYYRRVVILPLYPIMTNEEVRSVIQAVRETLKELG